MCPLGETFLGPVGPQTQNIQRQFSSNAVIPRKSCSTYIIVHTIPTKCWLHSRTFRPTPFSQPLSQNLWNLSPKQLSPLGPFLVTSPSSRSLCTIFTAVPAASSLAFPSFLGEHKSDRIMAPLTVTFRVEASQLRPRPAHTQRCHRCLAVQLQPCCSRRTGFSAELLPLESLGSTPHTFTDRCSPFSNIFPFQIFLLHPPASPSCLLFIHDNLIKASHSLGSTCHSSWV